MRTLKIEPIIIDKDDTTKNPMTHAEFHDRITDAGQILEERARIRVVTVAPIRRQVSASLYRVDSDFGERVQGLGLLLGKNSMRQGP
jgi:hypothetical protein